MIEIRKNSFMCGCQYNFHDKIWKIFLMAKQKNQLFIEGRIHLPENREYPRYRIIVDLKIHYKKREFMAAGFNISQGGIRFVAETKFKLHDSCTIEFIDAKGISIIKGGTIVNEEDIHKYPEMKKYGLRFASILTDDEIKMIKKKLGVPEKESSPLI